MQPMPVNREVLDMNFIQRWIKRRASASKLGTGWEPLWPVGYPPMPPDGYRSWSGVPEEKRGPVREWCAKHDEWMLQNGWLV